MTVTKHERFRREFGQRLHKLRLERQYTQEQLGTEANCTGCQISQYENARVMPNIENLADLARALDITSDYMLGLAPR